jgi:hypothetical protein
MRVDVQLSLSVNPRQRPLSECGSKNTYKKPVATTQIDIHSSRWRHILAILISALILITTLQIDNNLND